MACSIPTSCIVPMRSDYKSTNKKGAEAPSLLFREWRLLAAALLVLVLADLVADYAADHRAADRADRAAARRRAAQRAAGHRTADRALRLARNPALVQGFATRQTRREDDAQCDYKLAHVMPPVVKKRELRLPASRASCSRAAGR